MNTWEQKPRVIGLWNYLLDRAVRPRSCRWQGLFRKTSVPRTPTALPRLNRLLRPGTMRHLLLGSLVNCESTAMLQVMPPVVLTITQSPSEDVPWFGVKTQPCLGPVGPWFVLVVQPTDFNASCWLAFDVWSLKLYISYHIFTFI